VWAASASDAVIARPTTFAPGKLDSDKTLSFSRCDIFDRFEGSSEDPPQAVIAIVRNSMAVRIPD